MLHHIVTGARRPAGRRRGYYEPEDLGREQERRDAARPGRRFVVYLLDTAYGHYVGHTAHLGARLRQHGSGEVLSTAGGRPSLLWTSRPCATRREAARLEAALKSLRDRRSSRFSEITGVAPDPFDRPGSAAPWPLPDRRDRRRPGRLRCRLARHPRLLTASHTPGVSTEGTTRVAACRRGRSKSCAPMKARAGPIPASRGASSRRARPAIVSMRCLPANDRVACTRDHRRR